MNRESYILELEKLLTPLPSQERAEIIYDLNEHFDVALSQGKAEEEIIATLGNPQQIAEQYVRQVSAGSAQGNNGNSVLRALAVGGLGFVYITIIIPLLLSWAIVALSLVISGAAMLLAGLVPAMTLVFPRIFGTISNGYGWLINILVVIAIVSLGGIWTILSSEFTKWSFNRIKAIMNSIHTNLKWSREV